MTTGEGRLPSVYVDANILIFAVDRHPVWEPMLRPLMAAIDARRVRATTSELTYAEVMVKPLENGPASVVAAYEDLFSPGSPLRVCPVDREIVRRAARLRAEHHLKLADAVHLATALEQHCEVMITHDGALGQAAALYLRHRGLAGLTTLSGVDQL
jgi:predicted nucleic acid-binding protein